MKNHGIFKIICYILIITFSFNQISFASNEMRACLAVPSFFKKPCTVTFVNDKPLVKVTTINSEYRSFNDIPRSAIQMFLITLLAELFDNGVEDEFTITNLIEESVVKRFAVPLVSGNISIDKVGFIDGKLIVEFDSKDQYVFSKERINDTSISLTVNSKRQVFYTINKQVLFEEVPEILEHEQNIANAIVNAVLNSSENIDGYKWTKIKDEPSLEILDVPSDKVDQDVILSIFDIDSKGYSIGDIYIIRNDNVPIAICLKEDKDLKVFSIFNYFDISDILREVYQRKVAKALIFSGSFIPIKGQIKGIGLSEHLSVSCDEQGRPEEILHYKNFPENKKDTECIIPILPGVYEADSPTSLISARATWQYAKKGSKILIIGTGTGIEAKIAAQIGAKVDAVDIKKMAVENTKITCAGYEENVNSFVNDLFIGLDKYDLIIFNMPHVNGFTEKDGKLSAFDNELNSTDFGGLLLMRTVEGIREHMNSGAKAILLNTNNEEIDVRTIIEHKTGLTVTVNDFGVDTYATAYMIENTEDHKKEEPKKTKEEISNRSWKKLLTVFVWSLIIAPTELHNKGIPILAAILVPILLSMIIYKEIVKRKEGKLTGKNRNLNTTFYSINPLIFLWLLNNIENPAVLILLAYLLMDEANPQKPVKADELLQKKEKPATVLPLGGIDGPEGNAFLLNVEGKNILFDAGSDPKTGKLPDISGIDKLDYLIISHAHLDHTGGIGHVLEKFPDVQIITSDITLEAAYIMLSGSAKSYKKGQAAGISRHKLKKFYDESISLPMEKWYKLTDTIKIRFSPAGHIFGASSIVVATSSGNYMYSGDISVEDQASLKGFKFPEIEIDSVIAEALYGDREHEKTRQESKQEIADIINETVENGGRILIPAFAMGRSTEIALIIKELQASGAIPNIPVYIDGMAVAMTKIYEEYKDELLPENMRYLIEDNGKLFFNREGNIHEVRRDMREKVMNQRSPSIIIAGSGMLSGGRSLHYFEKMASNVNNAIILVGYQAEGTLGGKLGKLKRGAHVKNEGRNIHVNAKVYKCSFSAHADQLELLSFMNRVKAHQIILVHGAKKAKQVLQKIFSEQNDKAHIILPEKEKEIMLPEKDRREDFENIQAEEITVREKHETKRMSKKEAAKTELDKNLPDQTERKIKEPKKPVKTLEQKQQEFIDYIIIDMFGMEKTPEIYSHLLSVLEKRFNGSIARFRTHFSKFLFKTIPLKSTKEEMENLKKDLLKGFISVTDEIENITETVKSEDVVLPQNKKADPVKHEPVVSDVNKKPEAENSEQQMIEMENKYDWDKERSISEYDGIVRKIGCENTFSDALSKARVYIDAGCGNGMAAISAAEMYPDTKVYGIDIIDRLDIDSPENYTFLKGDISLIELPQKADLITSFFVFQYLKDPVKAFANLYDQLNVNGTMIISFAAPKETELEGIYSDICDKLMRENMTSYAYLFKRPEKSYDVYMIALQKTSDKKIEKGYVSYNGQWVEFFENFQKFAIYVPEYQKAEALHMEKTKKNALVLYADDIFAKAVFADTDDAFEDLVSEKGLLYDGNLVLYVNDTVYEKPAKDFAQKIESLSRGRTKVTIISKKDTMLSSVSQDNIGSEIDTLIRLLSAKGIKQENILALVKTHENKLNSLECASKVPLILLNISGVDNRSKGLFRFSDILFSVLTAEGDPEKLIQILDPVAMISMNEAYERYILQSELIAVAA
ncbi:MAG: methyltransferase domain-containing protein [Candidatus Omnitrophica bacterium]|nr:methyltransferase domain-containing protein [Candidatus Omnitrophota bacterium]